MTRPPVGPRRRLGVAAFALLALAAVLAGFASRTWAEEPVVPAAPIAEDPAAAPSAEDPAAAPSAEDPRPVPGGDAESASEESDPAAEGGEASSSAEAEDDGDGPMTSADMERWIRESPLAFWSVLILRYGAALLGLVFLALAWRRWDRQRAGIDPPPLYPSPTILFGRGNAFLLTAVFYFMGALVGSAVLEADPGLKESIVFQLAAAQFMLLPLAMLVIVRRRQLRAGPPFEPGRIFAGGFRTFCVASALVVPAMFVSIFVLTELGRSLELQGPVEEIAKGGGTALPWIVAFFAVVLAPIAEESVFRALLYPALRGPNASRGRVFFAAVVISLFFALVHYNEASFLPLFVLAMVLTWVFERTNSLATVMVAHGLWNLSTVFPLVASGLA